MTTKGGILDLPSCLGAASFAGAADNSQDVEENVDDISVEVEGSENVLLRTQRQFLVAQEKLSVHSQKAGEEQGPQRGIDDVQDLVANEEAEDGEEQQHDQAHKQHAPAGSEVILAL